MATTLAAAEKGILPPTITPEPRPATKRYVALDAYRELVRACALGRRRVLGHDSARLHVYGRRGHAIRHGPSHRTGRHTSGKFSSRADALHPSHHLEPNPHLGFRRSDQAAIDQRSFPDCLHLFPCLSHHALAVAIPGPRGFSAARGMDGIAFRFPGA